MKTSSKPDVTDLIGQRLRKYYDEVADQPVPDRFLHLLDKLDEATSSKKSK
ncbi:MAG: NepR family anti-sigma factor [Aestuariivirga sp.]